jgi:RHS repeat-associated protein
LRTKVTTASNQNVQDLTYTYDAVGNILQIVDSSQTQTAKTTDYTYDDLHRLLSATITNSAAENVDGPGNGNQVQTFTYDAIGNILSKSDVGSYSYNGSSGIANFANPHAVTSTADSHWYEYDHNGNMLAASGMTPNDSKTYQWDYNNRLSSVTTSSGTLNYAYDAGGQRYKSTDATGTTLSVTNEYSVTPNGLEKHIFLGDTAIATISTSEESTSVYNIHADHLTGSNVITDHDQQVNELTDYYAFGTMRIDQQNGQHAEKRKFTGHEFDQGTALNYMEARYQDGKRGQFLSQDPRARDINPQNQREQILLANPQRVNMYSYAIGNPIRYNDPNGESAWDKVNGFANAVFSNNAFGAGRIPSNLYSGNRVDYQSGQSVGDVFSMIQAAVEIAGGGGDFGGGGAESTWEPEPTRVVESAPAEVETCSRSSYTSESSYSSSDSSSSYSSSDSSSSDSGSSSSD